MAKPKYDSSYETFDSGSGPTISDKGEYSNMDSSEGLDGYTQNAVDDDQGSVPEVPSRKR